MASLSDGKVTVVVAVVVARVGSCGVMTQVVMAGDGISMVDDAFRGWKRVFTAVEASAKDVSFN